MTRNNWIAIAGLGLLLLVLALFILSRCGVAPEPIPPTVTPTIPVPPATLTSTPELTATRATMTPEASKTPVATFTPTIQGVTLTPTTRPTATGTATPVPLGIHTVVKGDTLWDIAGQWYSGPGCYEYCGHLKWPLIYWANSQANPPQLIYIGERLVIPSDTQGQGDD